MRRGATIASDLGVSPVVGMIMILAISVTGIAAVVAWGLPAVDEMKATVEARAVTNQFKELDHDVKQLVSGTAERTAKRWQPSLSRGSISFAEASERWVIGYATCNGGNGVETTCNEGTDDEYDWSLQSVGDTDNSFSLRNNRAAGSADVYVTVSAVTLDNGAETPLCVYEAGAAQAANGESLAANGGTKTFTLFTSGCTTTKGISTAAAPGDVFRIDLTDKKNTASTADDETAGSFFIFDAGAARFTLDTTGTQKNVYLSNGAVVVGYGTNEVIDNTPGIPPPKSTPDGWQFFVRGSAFQGAASFAGESRFDILLSLYGTTTLAEETAGEIYVYVGGAHQDAWTNYFSTGNGYSFVEDTQVTDMTAFTQYVNDGGIVPVTFTLVHSVVRVEQ